MPATGSTLAALAALAAAAAMAAGCGAPGGVAGDAPAADRFDARRAFADVRAQVRRGPRPAGSPASRRLARHLAARLPRGTLEPVAGGLRNVVGRLPGRLPATVVAAHYDTKDLPGFVGANDGASGVAVVLELARVLAPLHRPGDREIRFVLFDGEESPRGSADFRRDGLRGSRAYLAAHRREIHEVVVVDFVGDRDLLLPREAGSDPRLWARLRAAARRAGVARAFPAGTRGEILDDHTPFAEAGIPAIDLIDFDYPHFHRPSDTLDKVSAESLDAAGEALVELLRPR